MSPPNLFDAMKIVNIGEAHDQFRIHQTTKLSQAASMRLKTGEATSDKMESHPRSEQTVFMIEGEVIVEIDQDSHTLHAGEMVIIPPGVKHRFTNQSKQNALAFTTYTPPAYPEDSNSTQLDA